MNGGAGAEQVEASTRPGIVPSAPEMPLTPLRHTGNSCLRTLTMINPRQAILLFAAKCNLEQVFWRDVWKYSS